VHSGVRIAGEIRTKLERVGSRWFQKVESQLLTTAS
jgi:hypothetical protein